MIFYTPEYYAPIGEHVFPMEKYSLIVDKLRKERIIPPNGVKRPLFPKEEDILLVHEASYLEKLKTGNMSPKEIMILELPYSPELLRSAYWHTGGTISAIISSLQEGIGINVGGGFHHAFPDHGEGFCVFNDVAVGLMKALREGWIERGAVLDCDLHQGNGTAYIFREHPEIFTFSIHQENNYPIPKPPSDLDIGLKDGTSDEEYLNILSYHIPRLLQKHRPQLVLYIAGADPYREDRLGGLSLSKEGLKKRDKLIIEEVRKRGIPLVITLGGGYSIRLEDTVDIHTQTISLALKEVGENGSGTIKNSCLSSV